MIHYNIKMPAKQVASFVFTFNNYSAEQVEQVKALSTQSRYLVFGYEVGESGTPHLQGYCQLLKRVSLSKIGKMFPWHVEPTQGTPVQASEYCKKSGNIEEFGTIATVETGGAMGGEAEQARWREISDLAKEGRLDEIDAKYPKDYLRSYRMLKEVAKDHMKKPLPNDHLAGIWLHGPSGVGKSRSARAVYPVYYEKLCNKWWDGYQQEETVIIDDVDKNHACLGHQFKLWADHYAFIAETKGGAIRIRPERIIVTSQYSIDQIWEDEETRDAIHRRFHSTYLLDEKCCLEWKEEAAKQKKIVFSNDRS